MKQPTITLVQVGNTHRLEQILPKALKGVSVQWIPPQLIGVEDLRNRRLLFAVGMDAFGPDPSFYLLVRRLRQHPNCLAGCAAGLVVDGCGELYTKQAAQTLVMAANLAGCAFPGKPLVEGTGSLYNQHILANQLGITWEETYFLRVRELAQRVAAFTPPRFDHPRLLMIHASDNARSNTVWLGRQVLQHLPKRFSFQEVSLQNGTIQDCRGCSYRACRHMARQNTCFYSGPLSQEIIPAINACDVMLFLCPNYNDAVSANIMALFNRLTNLLHQHELYEKYLFGIVVSGYSGSDLVAQQLLGAMCFNKTAQLPPQFCLMETAHESGSAQKKAGIQEDILRFASHIESAVLRRTSA
ncbi:MAG: NAD(P)H-dependent oxidoreductase [Bacillota bacterium]|nr:NAD(P)H-dependent oxidoreductase [Bacillota bacterium]